MARGIDQARFDVLMQSLPPQDRNGAFSVGEFNSPTEKAPLHRYCPSP